VLAEILQHVLEMGDREYKLPLIGTIEKHGRDLAHPYDIAQMRLHIGVRLRPFGLDIGHLLFGRQGRFFFAALAIG
jgi:hypothetical protein